MNTFIIPMMFLRCMTWEPQNGEIIRGFYFEQPMSIVVEHSKVVDVEDTAFLVIPFCTSLVANDHSLINYYGNIWAMTSGNVQPGK